MWASNSWLCIIDMKNQQSEYSNAIQMIRGLEKLGSGGALRHGDTIDLSGLQIAHVPNGDEETEQIEKIEARLSERNPKRIRNIKTWKQLEAGVERTSSIKGFSYYIRIDIGGEGSDLSDLRYLVLLMQSIPEICNKLTVFFPGEDMSRAANYRHYDRLSQFLRFIQNQYGVFYAVREERIKKLSTMPAIPVSFAPLLEIDRETYQAITETQMLSVDYHDEGFERLFTAIVPKNIENSDVITLFQVGLRMFFLALNGNQYRKKGAKPQLLKLLCNTVQEAGGISALDMLIFGALMNREAYNTFGKNEAAEYLNGVKTLAGAIAQVLENITQHSQYRRGVFAIRLQKESGYIRKNYPGYKIDNREYGLELLIADANERDGIVQNFLAGGKATAELKSQKDEITLADFFQDPPKSGAAQAWHQARYERPELCHGLLAFASAVKWFHGAISVRSSPSSAETGGKDLFYYDYLLKPDAQQVSYEPRVRWVAGTQFSIIFKRAAFRADIQRRAALGAESIFYAERIIYGTTYYDLAWTLRYGSNLTPLFPQEDAVRLTERFMREVSDLEGRQAQKDEMVQRWKSWFCSRAAEYDRKTSDDAADEDHSPHYVLLDVNLSEFSKQPREVWETFCKGFLSSSFFAEPADKCLHYVILFWNMSSGLGETFYQTLAVLHERICISTTCVYFYQKQEAGGAARYIGATLYEALFRLGVKRMEALHRLPKILPYSVLVKEDGMTRFEQDLIRQADVSILDPEKQGYKVADTHMRLGNKVHIDAFFEMALFFESPNYAYYTAFLLLQRMKDLGLEKFQRVLFYGYTSYSRGIVWAAIRIWREYIEMQGGGAGKPDADVSTEFVIYQNDLKLESTRSSVQMYYSNKEWLHNPRSVWNPDDKTALIQIVPISSSLTTFNKMLSKLNSETGKQFTPWANLTALWVRDDFEKKWREAGHTGRPDERIPTNEEEYFWQKTDSNQRTVTRGPEHGPAEVPVQYLTYITSYWRNPLSCEKCFPVNPLLEYPLVETDPTSTVPTQQFYRKVSRDAVKPGDEADSLKKEKANDKLIAALRGNVLYGHISRGHNHFQYYVKTRQFFQQERDRVSEWLGNLPKREEKKPCIDILVVPKQTSNVEFSQFVYEYYFMGAAESIIVNTEKEFRSNFLAEYSGLFRQIRMEQENGRRVRFHYVDMAISSGTTFNRAAALIRSLFGRDDREKGPDDSHQLDERATFPFESVFLLISRMSEESKKAYVKNPASQFHAYVELNISNIRTYGDSCVPCKLKQEAQLHYQNAATKLVSQYWENKSISRTETLFDLHEQADPVQENDPQFDLDEGYHRMACTHRATAYIIRARGMDIADYFAALKGFFTELLSAVENEKNEDAVSPVYKGASKEPLKWLSAGLKIIVRPFFSFDFKLRCAAMDLYLLLADHLLNPEGERPKATDFEKSGKSHLDKAAMDWVWGFADSLSMLLDQELADTRGADSPDEVRSRMSYHKLRFIQQHLLKGLTDLKSNYILRRSTILQFCRRLDETGAGESEQNDFFNHYLRSILRLMHTSSDETKSVWLEHLLQYQQEYLPDEDIVALEKCADSMEAQMKRDCPGIHSAFRRFFDLLLVENNRTLFQGVRDYVSDSVDNQKKGGSPADALKEYYMRNVCQFINLGSRKGMSTDSEAAMKDLPRLRKLYLLLNPPEDGITATDISENTGKNDGTDFLIRYDSLRRAFQNIISNEPAEAFRENAETSRKNQVLLFGELNSGKNADTPPYYMISPRPGVDYSGKTETDAMLDRLAERLKKENLTGELEKTGYLLLKCPREQTHAAGETEKEECYDIILILDNNFETINKEQYEKYAIQKIEPVYIFLPCGSSRIEALMVVRKILMFRCKLVACLEQDFNNHAIASLSRQRYWTEILGADKVGDHNEHSFIECVQQVVTDQGIWDGTDLAIINKNGKEEILLEKKQYNWSEISDEDKSVYAYRWYLLCSYINSRISRLYRTYAREANHREYTGDKGESSDEQIKKLYARENQRIGMEPAHNLGTMFFTQITAGYSRKSYLAQMMQAITFYVENEPDTAKGDTEDQRLEVLKKHLMDYECVQFTLGTGSYAYLAEYLSVILLDCCISALKVGQDWKETRWEDLAFLKLCEKDAPDKCKVWLYREPGETAADPNLAFDYLVIKNDVYAEHDETAKHGPGMSQKAIRWYIDKLWQVVCGPNSNYPRVIFSEKTGSDEQYYIKLPILKRKEGT